MSQSVKAVYKYHPPKPIAVRLNGEWGFEVRQRAAEYLKRNLNMTGAERGNEVQQGFGVLAEIVVRNKLEKEEINPNDHPLGYDILLNDGIKADVKCRGGQLPFRENYVGRDGLPREAKHNLFARQVYDDDLDADIYVMTHLESPKGGSLPGTRRQRKWTLYVCGWVSKKRVAREGVYLPRESLTERGRSWFAYRGQEIEFYNRNLNGLVEIKDLLAIESADVEEDSSRKDDLNMTSVDAIRISYDLVGRGLLTREQAQFVRKETELAGEVKPILHPNQYLHLLRWLKNKGQVTTEEYQKAEAVFPEEPYDGI